MDNGRLGCACARARALARLGCFSWCARRGEDWSGALAATLDDDGDTLVVIPVGDNAEAFSLWNVVSEVRALDDDKIGVVEEEDASLSWGLSVSSSYSLTDSLACLSLVARIGDSDAEECCRRAIQSHSGGSRTFPVHAAFRHTDITPFPPPSCPLSPVADLPHKLSSAATTKTSLFEHLQSRPYSMPKYLNGAPFCASQKPRHNCCVKSSTRVCEVPLRRPVLIELVDAKQPG